jgi:hypothetical protein
MLPTIIFVIVASDSVKANVLLTFDDVATSPSDPTAPMPTDYGGVAWSSFGWGVMNPSQFATWSGLIPPGGYANGLVSAPNVGYGDPGATISSLSPSGFSLIDGYFTAAWNNNLELSVNITFDDLTTTSETFIIGTAGPSMLQFGWTNIMSVTFLTTGGTPAGYPGSGTEFVMDNLVLGAVVPEPSTSVMLFLGFLGFGYTGYRRAKEGHANLADGSAMPFLLG